MKIATIVGARPQFIKAAALSRAIARKNANGKRLTEILIHTGQHYDHNMSEIFFQEMNIPAPDYHLGIGGCSQGAMTGRMLEAIEAVLLKEKPDWTLVYGDTNSTLAGALAAVKLHIPVAHVEAGLRSFNRKMPEEINRLVADQCSDLLFTPSATATRQLLTEGIPKEKIAQVGDVMFDAALYYQKLQQNKDVVKALGMASKQYVLATIHRAENTDDHQRIQEIFHGLNDIAAQIPVILPVHPRTRQVLDRHQLLPQKGKNLHLIEPVGYLDMIQLEANARVIMTDSGGVQKEAYFFKTPCLTLRDETEWVELVECGYNILVPADRKAILDQYTAASKKEIKWHQPLYGHGNSSEEILQKLLGIGLS